MKDSDDLNSALESIASFGRLDLKKLEAFNYDEWRAKQQEWLLKRLDICHLCKGVFKYLELHGLRVRWDTHLYCAECLPKVKNEHTYTCRSCQTLFFSRQKRSRCEQCRIHDRKTESKVIQRHKQKSKQDGLPATLTLDQWLYTLEHFHGKCAYCQEQPYEELDHFVPPEAGGGTTMRNCVPACKFCNNAKSNFNPRRPPLHHGTNYIVRLITPKNIDSQIFNGIKRVAAYLKVPFPYIYDDKELLLGQKYTPIQKEE